MEYKTGDWFLIRHEPEGNGKYKDTIAELVFIIDPSDDRKWLALIDTEDAFKLEYHKLGKDDWAYTEYSEDIIKEMMRDRKYYYIERNMKKSIVRTIIETVKKVGEVND
jgi:hypothetical protein